MTQRTPKEIAEGLTEAQRRALLDAREEPQTDAYQLALSGPNSNRNTARALRKRGIVDYAEWLTPLGLSVRQAILEEQE